MQELNASPRSFWKRPEGKLGGFVGLLLLGALGFFVVTLPWAAILANTIYFALTVGVLALMVFMVVNKRMRNLIWYMYKSVMRFITGIFIQIDPIGIIESYMDDLKTNLKKMGKQIANLRGQMRKLKTDIEKNRSDMERNLALASKAKEIGKDKIMILKSRKAGRLQESNLKLSDLYRKMEVMYRVLVKMYENSEILLEDIQDEVAVRKREREAIQASHSAMQSARNIIAGDKDRKEMFDAAMESIAEDVGKKVGEMERFMEISAGFMDSIDLQNGVFEEEGLEMLEKWEKEGASFLLGDEKQSIIDAANNDSVGLDLDAPLSTSRGKSRASTGGANSGSSNYQDLFDF